MWDRLRRVFGLRPEGHEGIETPAGVEATFRLDYGDLEIGTLELRDRVWTFRYSDAFRAQDAVHPLIDFPDASKTYRAPHLWPFFEARIPSLAQPHVRATIEAEGLDLHSDVDLLKRFGQRTISNPFILRSA